MASIKLFQKDKALKDGTFPICLRIIKHRKIKYIFLGYSCKKSQWNKEQGLFKKNFDNQVKRNLILQNYKSKALQILDDFKAKNKDFTLNQFEEIFRGQAPNQQSKFFDFFQERIDDLGKANQTGNKRIYHETLTSFKKFIKVSNPDFEDITPTLLEKYEIHLRSQGGTNGGISVKMRTLRAVYNNAIKKGLVKDEHYPFKVYQISKLKGKGLKRALSREEVKKIENLDLTEYPHLVDARNYFIFSYYTRGMNFIDMLKLRWNENIFDDKIIYQRSKTKSNFVVKVLPPIKKILDYYQTTFTATQYVFPILLKDNLTPNQIENRKKKTLKKFNKDLKEIAQILGLKKNLTSYVARHSYATNLKDVGVSTAVISESMGHKNQEVTETYLKSFSNDIIDEATERLL